ncbi:hypothetical protein AALO_G00011030 [Alosa alosa]|uniref:Uncharacterized protein n=1 Tax=Alosa alosa TaxID=278164 RepID=A0AAV6HFW8_9TELE|nr:uncharacterized protein si:ch211-122l24.6 [Alosa alosa]KAG5286108.1 hypothetical protein AALO_G00011030 [Alosa alosa]
MGMSLSYPLVNEPESYVDPDFDEESNSMDFGKELHDITLSFCYDMIQHRIRSIREKAKFQMMDDDWPSFVENWKQLYPEWTTDDFLNLRHQFEFFDICGDKLLNFTDFCAALDLVNYSDSEEKRRALFDRADFQKYHSINLEEYLQLMYDIKKGMPIVKRPETEEELDQSDVQELVNKVAHLDPFRQMCYGVF